MSRISANSFLVDAEQRIQMSLSNISPDIAGLTVAQPDPNLLNCNANCQQGDADVSTSNPLYVQFNAGGEEVDIVKVNNAAISLAQKNMASSFPVVIASDQSAISVNPSEGDVDLMKVGGSAIAIGQAAMAASLPIAIASDQSAISVNPSEGDVDLVKVGGTAIAIGQAASGASLPVVIASDQSRVNCDSNLQIADADVSESNRVPTNSRHDVAGAQGNLSNAQSVISGNTSTAVNVEEGASYTIFGNSTDVVNSVDIEVSVDNSNYYPTGLSIFPDGSGNLFTAIQNTPVKYLRLKYNGTATVTAQVTFA
jgi:hypothetical protein